MYYYIFGYLPFFNVNSYTTVKKEDSSKLALFYWADEELTMVATELDSFDGRTDPDRCSILVSQLRICQDKVLSICNDIMDEAIPDIRANRDFRAKFPDDVLHENLAGQLWFGAECLAAGSNIIHRELESASMRPLAKALTRALDNVRCLLREQSLKNSLVYSDKVREALRIFDRLFAEFELCYVSAMVPIKSAKEYHLQQEIVVLFSETLIRALKMGMVTQDMVDDYDPSLMFTIPRLAIVWGLLLYPDGPFNVEKDSSDISELFRPFCNLLFKIRDLLWTLTEKELHKLEKMLCSLEEPKIDDKSEANDDISLKVSEDSVSLFYKNQLNCKQFIHEFYAYNFGILTTENGIPENSEDTLNTEKHSSNKKKHEKNQNSIEFEVKYHNSSTTNNVQKSYISNNENFVTNELGLSDCDETRDKAVTDGVRTRSDNIEESFSDERFRPMSQHLGNAPAHHNQMLCNLQNAESYQTSSSNNTRLQNQILENKEYEDSWSEAGLRTSLPHIENNEIVNDVYSQPASESTFLEHSASSLENRLSVLHDNCTCNLNSSSREHLTPSREIMRQVMRKVEIVPPGQRVSEYSSSLENSPRAYHHGLLSRSFPIHPHASSETPRKRTKKGRSKNSQPSARQQNEKSPSRCCSDNYRHAHPSEAQNSNSLYNSSPLMIPRVQHLRQEENSEATYSSCSSCQSISSVSSSEWESTSPDTSSYNSECQDDEEIALALQAAEIASRNKARSRFKSSRDLLHKLFVCVSGVADQLQTNYASDLRNILKSVFDMNCSQSQQEVCDNSQTDNSNDINSPDVAWTLPPISAAFSDNGNSILTNEMSESLLNGNSPDEYDRDQSSVDSAEEVVADNSPTPSLVLPNISQQNENSIGVFTGPPEWMPDEFSPNCMACKMQFTILRRRHHCRNCGKIFCSRCSSNTIALPHYGHLKPVRVCNHCFMYQLTSFVMQRQL
nr:lateral signaling target protein 2 homolog isoform X1 [Parasteatoda tepidariorum]